MAKVGRIIVTENENYVGAELPSNENVSALLFDINGFEVPFNDFSLLNNNFGSEQVQCIKGLEDAKKYGIEDNDFLNGVFYYHISSFYNYYKAISKRDDVPLYIMVANCSGSDNWGVVEKLQKDSGGKLFQIGVWTCQPIWKLSGGEILFTGLINNLQRAAETVCGKIGVEGIYPTPVSIIASANSNYIEVGDSELSIDYNQIPNATVLNCPKVSLLVMQNGSDAIHKMQEKNPNKAPVGAVGFAIACLAWAGAEESIGGANTYDLNQGSQFDNPEMNINGKIIEIQYDRENQVLINKDGLGVRTIGNYATVWTDYLIACGYIVPVERKTQDGKIFFSGDSTLSNGDYKTIANNRIIHKCRRILYSALLPYVNSSYVYNATQMGAPSFEETVRKDVRNNIDAKMKNKDGREQLEQYDIQFDNKNALSLDSVSLKILVKPVNYSDYIGEQVDAV